MSPSKTFSITWLVMLLSILLAFQPGCWQTSKTSDAVPPDSLLSGESTEVDLCADETGPGLVGGQYRKPEFPGGEACFENFIRRHFRMPPGFAAHKDWPDYEMDMVAIKLFFDEKGKLEKYRVFQEVPECSECTVVAEEIVRKMPDWEPGAWVTDQGKVTLEKQDIIINIHFDGRHYLQELPCEGRKPHR